MSPSKHAPLSVRAPLEVIARWRAQAEKVNLTLNSWIVQTLNNASRESNADCPHPEDSRQRGAAGTIWCGNCGQQALPV